MLASGVTGLARVAMGNRIRNLSLCPKDLFLHSYAGATLLEDGCGEAALPN